MKDRRRTACLHAKGNRKRIVIETFMKVPLLSIGREAGYSILNLGWTSSPFALVHLTTHALWTDSIFFLSHRLPPLSLLQSESAIDLSRVSPNHVEMSSVSVVLQVKRRRLVADALLTMPHLFSMLIGV